jgi:tRNA (cytidine32/guanosine34-2'-O)-methyltransferase
MGKPYDGRETDAWAMGVVLYALVVGELPFDVEEEGLEERGQRKRRMMRIAKGEYSWRTGVGSAGVKAVVSKLLVRDAKKRRKVSSLWDQEWMRGPGEVSPPDQVGGAEGGGMVTGRGRRVLDGFLLDEEVEAEAQAEAV